MKNAITLIAIAGIASVVSAQSFSLDIIAPTEVAEGSVFTIEVTGDSDFGTHILSGAFSLTSGSGLIDSMTWTPADWSTFNQDDGYAGNGNYNQVGFGQLILNIPGLDVPGEGSELGGVIGSFQISLVSSGTGVIDIQLLHGDPYTLESINMSKAYGVNYNTTRSNRGFTDLDPVTVNVIPAPSAMALLGL